MYRKCYQSRVLITFTSKYAHSPSGPYLCPSPPGISVFSETPSLACRLTVNAAGASRQHPCLLYSSHLVSTIPFPLSLVSSYFGFGSSSAYHSPNDAVFTSPSPPCLAFRVRIGGTPYMGSFSKDPIADSLRSPPCPPPPLTLDLLIVRLRVNPKPNINRKM